MTVRLIQFPIIGQFLRTNTSQCTQHGDMFKERRNDWLSVYNKFVILDDGEAKRRHDVKIMHTRKDITCNRRNYFPLKVTIKCQIFKMSFGNRQKCIFNKDFTTKHQGAQYCVNVF